MSGTKIFVIRLISLVATLAVAVMIFALSSQPAKESKKTSDKVVELVQKSEHINKLLPEKKWKKNEIIRGLAHIFLFLVLGISSSAFVYTFTLHWAVPPILSLLFCALYSVSDEYHQKFVEGRSWEYKDLMFDCLGYMTGIAITAAVYYITKYVINSRRNTL